MGKVEKLKKALLKEYKNKDILVMLEGFIKTYIIIKNSKILINNINRRKATRNHYRFRLCV